MDVEAERYMTETFRLDSNAVAKLKILLSVYRRVASLARKQAEGKMQITAERRASADAEADEH
jgi:hypothetical protein